jgi:uncharacterized protein (TIGR03000 family)
MRLSFALAAGAALAATGGAAAQQGQPYRRPPAIGQVAVPHRVQPAPGTTHHGHAPGHSHHGHAHGGFHGFHPKSSYGYPLGYPYGPGFSLAFKFAPSAGINPWYAQAYQYYRGPYPYPLSTGAYGFPAYSWSYRSPYYSGLPDTALYAPGVAGWGPALGPYTSGYLAPETGTADRPAADVAAAGNTARLTVRVPENARLWVDDRPSQQTGPLREFTTPATLQPGQAYKYTVRAEWEENGRPVTQSRTVEFRAGGSAYVDFTQPAG